jgi:MinD superfamily P-loop ATPase
MKPENLRTEDFISGETANIDQDLCTQCGLCKEVCRFDAIDFSEDTHSINEISCEGCGYCARICPVEAITNTPAKVGKWYAAKNRFSQAMSHAKLDIGADNSGKLVAQVKQVARELADIRESKYIVVDGSPGIGCPVVSSISGADYVVLVTEPSVSGIHDLKRVYELIKKFQIPAACIINKADLDLDKSEEIKTFLNKESIHLLSEIPYNENFTKALTQCKTIVEYEDEHLKQLVTKAWQELQTLL